MRKNIFKSIFLFIEKNPLPLLFISLILTVASFFAFIHLPLKSDYVDLMPQNMPAVKNLRFLSKKIGGIGALAMVVESTSSNDVKAMKKFSDDLVSIVTNWKEIQYVEYKIPTDFFIDNAFYYMTLKELKTIKKRLHAKVEYEMKINNPFYLGLDDEEKPVGFDLSDIISKYTNSKKVGIQYGDYHYLISKDRTLQVLYIKPNFMPTRVDLTRKLFKKLKTTISNLNLNSYSSNLSVGFDGNYTLSYDQANAITKDIQFTSILAIVLVFLSLLFFLKNFKYSIYTILALAAGILWSYGLAYFIIGHINLITGFLMAILLGLGVNYGIHFVFRYNEERDKGLEKSEALKTSFITTGYASLTGANTTAAAFFALAFSRFKGFSEFGLLAGFGILFSIIAIYMIVTALISLTDSKQPKRVKTRPHEIYEIGLHLSRNIRPLSIGILIVFLLLSVGAAFFVPKVHFEYDAKKLEVKGQQSLLIYNKIQKKFGTSTDPVIVYTYNRDEERDFYTAATNKDKSTIPMIEKIASLSGLYPDPAVQKEKLAVIKSMRSDINKVSPEMIGKKISPKMLKKLKEVVRKGRIIQVEDLPDIFKRRFALKEGDKILYMTLLYPKDILYNAHDMINFVKQASSIQGKKKHYEATGLYVLYVKLIEIIFSESRIFVSIVVFIIWILLLVDFRNLKDSLLVMIPIVFGILWLLGIMGLFGLRFNFMNMVVLPIVLGTGVDNGVHIFHRYRETGNIWMAVRKTGSAAFAMSFTVALGWSVLFAAKYNGLKTMACIAVIGIMMTYIASITLMPALTYLLDNKKGKR